MKTILIVFPDFSSHWRNLFPVKFNLHIILNFCIYCYFLVKSAGANGDKLGLGNRNRLNLTLFIQQCIQAFQDMPDVQQSKTPLDWVNRVHQIMNHFRGDHSNCGILERFWFEKF